MVRVYVTVQAEDSDFDAAGSTPDRAVEASLRQVMDSYSGEPDVGSTLARCVARAAGSLSVLAIEGPRDVVERIVQERLPKVGAVSVEPIHQRYQGLTPERLAERLAEDVIQLGVDRQRELAMYLSSKGWAERKQAVPLVNR